MSTAKNGKFEEAAVTDTDLAGRQRTVDLLWGLKPAPTRGPKPALSIDGIAATAVHIADAEGIEAVTMQRVAEALTFTKMSLYRHVAGKADLVAVMIEAAVGVPDLGPPRRRWRAKLSAWAEQLWATWDAHRWLPLATVGDRVLGPRELAWTEAVLAALAGTGLPEPERIHATTLLSGHLRGSLSPAMAGTQPWTTHATNLLLTGDRRFPAVTAAFDTVGTLAPTPDHGRMFGLRCILDGIQTHIDRQAHPHHRA